MIFVAQNSTAFPFSSPYRATSSTVLHSLPLSLPPPVPLLFPLSLPLSFSPSSPSQIVDEGLNQPEVVLEDDEPEQEEEEEESKKGESRW